MKILVTGFKPFLGEKLNPSEILSQELEKKFSEVSSLILPVEFGRSFVVLKEHLLKNRYDYVMLLGQATGRKKISLEKIALNWVQTEYEDESGSRPDTGVISENKPLALMSLFPVDEVCAELRKKNLPVEISFSAGTFVCNDLYYRTLNEFDTLRTVFIHVPLIKEQLTDQDEKHYIELSQQKSILISVVKHILKK